MEKKTMLLLAQELAKDLKTPADVSKFSSMLTKLTFEAGLGAEMEQHLGYKKNGRSDNPNSRNGYGKKTIKTDTGEVEINTPRDRDGSFEPGLIKKGQCRITGFGPGGASLLRWHDHTRYCQVRICTMPMYHLR